MSLVQHEGSIYMVNLSRAIIVAPPPWCLQNIYYLTHTYIEEQLVCVDEKWKKPTVLLIFAGARK